MKFKWNSMLLMGAVTAFSIACDADKDGLSDSEEAELGTNPESADSDGDGLDDKSEVDQGTNPLSKDSDDDGCYDGTELEANSDPNDASDTIYAGNWPCYEKKDELANPGWEETAAEDGYLPRYVAQDQHGDMVDIYDFAKDNFIILDLSGGWCGWCRFMAMWLDGQTSGQYEQYFEGNFSSREWYERMPEMVENGDLTWITIIDSGDSASDYPTEADLQGWASDYPNPHIPVLLDVEHQMRDWFDPSGWPTVMLIGPDMKVLEYMSYDQVLRKTLEWYDANNP